MKRLSILLYIFLCFAALSCSKYLDEHPRDQLYPEDAYDTQANVYLNTVATLYNYIGGYNDSQGLQGTYRGIYDLNTFTTDEAILPTRGGDWYDGGFWQGLFLHKWGTNNDAMQATWEYLYKVIVLSNQSLEILSDLRQKTSYKDLDLYEAEVRALRGMYYYYLMDMFGRVPLIVSSSTPVKDVLQSERKEVFEFVVKELQESLPLLSMTRSNSQGDYYGRITRPVVYFLMAKLALNAEIFTDNDWTDGVRQDGKAIYFTVGDRRLNAWQTVVAYCDSITNLGYKLSPEYADNFSVFNESSVENILTIPMDKNLYTNQMQYLFRSRHYNHAKAYGLGGENGSSATVEALRTFAYGTDSVDTRFYDNYYADTMFDLNGDTIRLDNGTPLVYLPWEIKLDLSGLPAEKTAGARMKKYEIDKMGTKDGKLMDNDIVLFRYADVLLMRSEAKVRNGENGDEDLNTVRSRAGMPFREATLENLLAERQLEFAWEGWRRQDLVRFGQFTRSYTGRPQLPNESNGYTTVFPIPDKVRSLNPNLTQNPGY